MNPKNDNELTCSLKLPYKAMKGIKKAYGKNLAMQISFGRNLIKTMKKAYSNEPEK